MEKQTNNKTSVEEANDISVLASKIYMNITDIKDFSKQDLEKLLKENEDLRSSLNRLLTDSLNESDENTKQDFQKAILELILTIIFGIINVSIVSIMPTIGLCTTFAYLTYTTMNYVHFKNKKSKTKSNLQELKKDDEKISRIINNLDNNELFIKRELKKFEVEETKKAESQEASKSKSQEVSKVELANKVIQDFYETGIIPEISDELKETIIALLKNSVECKEINIITILEESRKKVNYEDSKSAKLELNKNGKN